MSRLILIRHAQPLIVRGLCYGQLDVEADLVASEMAARRLQQFLSTSGQGILKIYCSTLRRTRVLAQMLAANFPSVMVLQDARLNEMNFGCWEGVAWDQIPHPEVAAWTDAFGVHVFGGVESCNQVIRRVADAFEDLQKADLDSASDVLWVTHAGVIRALNYYLTTGRRDIDQAHDWPLGAPGFGEWEVKNLACENKF